ncbi:unnamed protein product (macronuclear) [Paramecium tetraurelia]|uniref:Uncharacterized protein n=1 Tax=Paramecium tetraurelia TaxID=5888 RepID=A0CXA1_PARTE|nr:uncharacterized protein GSPATT00011050001 [Paramecium tetraurelia]CAK75418.1 unnamed protein product [Paramecium tetraurelia]|eukprot:XP_001442815.1 hypothetical protein (macronuclear) [Paramecium tetraurelia strain d4-2]
MSKLNYVFKPLFIDTTEYSYMDGKTEKSFTIKNKLETKNGKGKMQQSEPLAQFKNDTMKQSNNRAQTSRWLRQSSFAKNSTINSNTPLNNCIIKTESRMEDEIIISNSRNTSEKRNINIPPLNYVDFNISVMNGEGSYSFYKALKLINKDQLLMRKKKKSAQNSKTVSTQENEITQFEQLENQHPKDMMEKISKMLAINERYTPVRKQSRTRETFTRNLKFLDQSFQESTSPDKKLQSVIQNYFDKKKAHEEEQNKQQEITLTQLSEQTRPNKNNNRMRISTTFLKQLVHQVDEEQKQKQTKFQNNNFQSLKSSQFKDKIKKKQNAIFSIQVRLIFKKMFNQILNCVRKMKLMKLTLKEIFQNGVIQKKAYEREGSFQFFEGIEDDNLQLINFMLLKCRYYAFDINEEGKTPLHISSKKGFSQITERLLQSGAYIDSVDKDGKTPLYYAIQSQQKQTVLLLLYYKANPWSINNCKYQCSNTDIMHLIKISRQIHLILLLTKYSDRDRQWQESRKKLLC